MNIKEDYVSFEVAKLLKEKGFDEPCRSYYIGSSGRYSRCTVEIKTNDCRDDEILRPTLQMACKWLREVHNVSIEITSTGFLIDGGVEWECDIKSGHRLYFKHITNERSYEGAVEAALKYTLENLI